MYRKKVYGESRVDRCPFCGKQATTKNWQNVTVCREHKDAELPDMKCVCGEYLDVKEGKYGYFFLCMNCGPVNQKRAFEMNGFSVGNVPDANAKSRQERPGSNTGRGRFPVSSNETVITSDDPRYFY